MPQIHTSNSISSLHLVVGSAGVGIGVAGFLEDGVGFVQCRQLARQATRPASKHNASTKKTIDSKIYCSKTNDLMQSFATILHQLRPRAARFLDPGSRSGHETQRPGPHWVSGRARVPRVLDPPRPGPLKARGSTRSCSRCQDQKLFINPPS